MHDLTVVIVTWNSADCIRDCLRSIDPPSRRAPTRVVVVDNASKDGTVPLVSREFPWADVVANRDNRGFGAANNQAFAAASSRYVMMLNPDTVARPGALDALVAFMDAHPEAWAAGPAMLNADGSEQRTGVAFPSLGNLLSETFFLDRLLPHSRLFGRHRRLFDERPGPREVDFVQGSALIFRREVLERVGGLDERFFMYFEETDWCFRMKRAGGRVLVCPDAQVVHLGGGEFGHFDERRLLHYHRSLLAFYGKHHGHAAQAALRAALLLRSALRLGLWSGIALLRPARRERARSSARGYAQVLRLLADGAPKAA